VQAAEAALHAAREENDKCVLYSSVTHRSTSSALALEARLSAALGRNEFFLHYQPKIDIASGEVQGFEALIRWEDSHEGLVPPNLFVPMLERSGAIIDVGEWVLLQAASDLRAWTAAGMAPTRVAVNVSPLQLRRKDFVDRVLAAGAAVMKDGSGIDVEITESMLMQDLEASMRKLAVLREARIGVAIDDFGTGYSSLGLLAKLPVDTLKIDRTFVQGIADTRDQLTLVSTIVSLARAFGMYTVAEGVEAAKQLNVLKRLRCDQAQGYLFARPMSASRVAEFVADASHSR
jgi:EAL domain-containing protein (putative c-di-GMP-specific phosphodiesterase class I)